MSDIHAQRSATRLWALKSAEEPTAPSTGDSTFWTRSGNALNNVINDVYRRFPDHVRGAIAYTRAVQPDNLLTAGGLVGGAALLSSALTPKKRSVTNRAIRGLLGTGLAAGGVYLARNQDTRFAIRKAVYELLGKALASRGNAATAK